MIALITGSGYTGVEVHLASRVCSAAHGGQVLMSQSSHNILGPSFNEADRLTRLGSYLLKDFDEPMELFQINIPGIKQSFQKPRLNT